MDMGVGESPLRIVRNSAPGQKLTNFVQLSHLRRMRGSEQVAAICYRVRKGEIEFLLVQTDGGRWTFPKGSVESGLTDAQSAALEAFEEAGVHGRIEEAAFAHYVKRKSAGMIRPAGIEVVINTHLCEVLWLEEPKELDRNPTWYSIEKAKRRLGERRTSEDGTEHGRIVDLAVTRIRLWHDSFAAQRTRNTTSSRRKR